MGGVFDFLLDLVTIDGWGGGILEGGIVYTGFGYEASFSYSIFGGGSGGFAACFYGGSGGGYFLDGGYDLGFSYGILG